jgi:uncharacterized protein Smg (DUF494 family)
MQVTISVDAFRKKLEERGFSATEIATALEVLEEMHISFASPR